MQLLGIFVFVRMYNKRFLIECKVSNFVIIIFQLFAFLLAFAISHHALGLRIRMLELFFYLLCTMQLLTPVLIAHSILNFSGEIIPKLCQRVH